MLRHQFIELEPEKERVGSLESKNIEPAGDNFRKLEVGVL